MGIFDKVGKIFKKEFNPNLFSFLLGTTPPEIKGSEYLKAYKGWVYTCVNAIAEEVANTELRLMKWTPKGNIEIYENIALDLLKNVNPFTTSSMLFLGTQSYLELNGNAFWYLPKGQVTKKPAEIWLLDPTKFTVVKSSEKIISGYIYRNEKGAEVPISTDEILHFKRFNPQDKYRGVGTVQAAAMAIDIDDYSQQWNRNFFYNSAVPSAVLETPGEISDEEFQRLKAKWDSYYQGLDNAHRLAILQGGLTYKPMTFSQKDMDFLEQRRYTRDEIMAMFRVPKTILGITEDVNRANAEASEYVFAKRVIQPRMQFLVDHLNEFYLPLFGINSNQMWFEFEDPVPENIELGITYRGSGIRDGWLTPNEAREMEGLSPIENGDQVFTSALMVPLGEPMDDQVRRGYNVKKKEFSQEQLKAVNERVRFIVSEIKKRTKRFAKIYRQIGEDMAAALSKEGKSVSKGTLDNWLRITLGAIGTLDAYWGTELEDTHKTALQKAAVTEYLRLETNTTFDITNDRAVDYIATRGLMAVKSLDGTIKDKAKDIITQGVSEGWGPVKTAKELRQFYDVNADMMAKRLARTEIISAYQEGYLEAALDNDNVMSKSWEVYPDSCETCIANGMDGEIPKDAGFSSGDFAPPAHPNCRCYLESHTGVELSVGYQRAVEKAELFISNKAEEIKKEIEGDRLKAQEEADAILKRAKEEAIKIIINAKDQGETEKNELLKDLKKIKNKALKELYGEK